MLVGAVDVGKSTLTLEAANAALRAGRAPAILDTDLGQGEVGPPGTIGIMRLDEPAASSILRYLRTADRLLPGRVVGLYVVGSIALGAYRPKRSDVDIIVVVDDSSVPVAALRRLHLLTALRSGPASFLRGGLGLPGVCNATFVAADDLTERGYRQIEVLAELFTVVPLDAIYASPLGRAQATAETIARRNGARVITVDALREIQPGDFGGTEIPAIFAAVRAFFASPDTDWDTPYLGGETYRELRERVWPLIEEHGRRRDWRRVAVVAHGGVNNAVIGRVLGAEGPGLANIDQDFGCVNMIDYGGDRPVLRLLNFTAYDPLKTGLEVSSLDVLRDVLESAFQVSFDQGVPK